MNKFLLLLILAITSCNTEMLETIADLPKDLNEVSGTETIVNSDLIWMLNDGGNKAIIYGLSKTGEIKKELKKAVANYK